MRVMIVEDEMLIALALEGDVEDLGHEVCCIVDTAEKAIEMARVFRPDLTLMDVRLAGALDGVDAANTIHLEGTCPKVIFVTGSVDAKDRVNEDHPADLLFKPVSPNALAASINRL